MEKLKNPCHGNSTDPFDPFQRLPEDLVISIFKKLPNDLKFLTQCSLVSHLFAAAIHRLPAVELTITPRTDPLGEGRCIKFDFAKTRYSLLKFIDLRSLHLILPKDEVDRSPMRFNRIKVKAEAEFYTVAYLNVMCNHDVNSPRYKISPLIWLNKDMRKFNILWHDLLVMIIRDCPMLQSVKISSSLREMCLNGEELVKLKDLVGAGESKSKLGFIRSLHLPVAGRMLKDVFVHIHRVGQPGKLPENEDDIMGWDYGEERDDKVFGEAIKSIIMNHRNELRSQLR